MTTQVLFQPGHHDQSIPSVSSGKKRSIFDHANADTENELLLRATASHTVVTKSITLLIPGT